MNCLSQIFMELLKYLIAEGETLVNTHKGLQSNDSDKELDHSNLQRWACYINKNLRVLTVDDCKFLRQVLYKSLFNLLQHKKKTEQ